MDEYLEEIIKLAWKNSPIDTEYYLTKYIINLTSELDKVFKTMDLYETNDAEDGIYYNHCLDKSKNIENELTHLNYLLSSLRGI